MLDEEVAVSEPRLEGKAGYTEVGPPREAWFCGECRKIGYGTHECPKEGGRMEERLLRAVASMMAATRHPVMVQNEKPDTYQDPRGFSVVCNLTRQETDSEYAARLYEAGARALRGGVE